MRSSNQSIDTKRIRRTLEPEGKLWNDELLETPWDDIQPPLSKHSVFAMKNIFFFSHATAVQAATVSKLSAAETSAVVEAPTGCGKTLAFLIPVLERIVSHCDAHIAAFKRPILTRRVVAIALSPSRVLAEQTFVVARNLAARFPHNIHVALCDGVVERAESVVEHLSKAARGAGIILISTPHDLTDFFAAYHAHKQMSQAKETHAAGGVASQRGGDTVTDEMLSEQSEETRLRYLKKLERKRQEDGAKNSAASLASTADRSDALEVRAHSGTPFFFVLDEADVILRADEMREAVRSVLLETILPNHRMMPAIGRDPEASAAEKKNSGKKRSRKIADDVASALAPPLAAVDFGLFGATAGTSKHVQQFCTDMKALCKTDIYNVILKNQKDFVSQLSNQFFVCESHELLHTLVHCLNLHPAKKHFVFFNSTPVLQFVRHLLQVLSKGKRPVLYVSHIYAMFEEMKENTKFAEYNGFLQHITSKATTPGSHQNKPKSFAEEKNQRFQGGWKRDGAPPPGTGAVLLCTDMAAFGLDVRDVDYVYHFEPPTSLRSYVHRIGRVGRMGMRGSSVLLLPTMVGDATAADVDRERKSTSTRFNTIVNTKSSTANVQNKTVDETALTGDKALYLHLLRSHHQMEPHRMSPVAPITSTIRAVIHYESNLLKLARQAAVALCRAPPACDVLEEEEIPTPESDADATPLKKARTEGASWYDPTLAVAALLLD